MELVIYSVVAFFAPFIIGHPQWLVGTIVNSSLVLAGLNIRNYKVLPIILLPSMGVLTRGIIFGPMTIFLLYMIPAIWIGNTILVYAMKFDKLNKWLRMIIGSIAKTAFLLTFAFAMVKIGILPLLFLTTMGIFQLYTAIIGGSIAIGIHEAKKKLA